MSSRLAPNKKTLERLGDILIRVLIYLSKLLVDTIILAKAVIKDTRVTHKNKRVNDEMNTDYSKKGIRSKKF